jgi:hypothetical protein
MKLLVIAGFLGSGKTMLLYACSSVDPDFCSEFADAMFILHKDLDRFPSVNEFFGRFGRDV